MSQMTGLSAGTQYIVVLNEAIISSIIQRLSTETVQRFYNLVNCSLNITAHQALQ